jgi:hypothetical protein
MIDKDHRGIITTLTAAGFMSAICLSISLLTACVTVPQPQPVPVSQLLQQGCPSVQAVNQVLLVPGTLSPQGLAMLQQIAPVVDLVCRTGSQLKPEDTAQLARQIPELVRLIQESTLPEERKTRDTVALTLLAAALNQQVPPLQPTASQAK